ncbi:ferric-dicitrate binding protein FerR (iron transport regulator) [Pedobacter sp. AK013]|uniref:FecR family protein n=1 Tax=Pedobacter sp. AK013 TaxID=2723071 RepID=UPI001608D02F|nr:FecR family protein [Pedobacter sp. AK013]MBB6239646.1 ferric-dicitrate binding protein FerR (iron transport regulator) [Pedobacter sp. AK013]
MNKQTVSKFIRDYLHNKLNNKQNAQLETWYLLKAEENKSVDSPIEYEKLEAKIWNKILSNASQTEVELPIVQKLNRPYKRMISIGIAASILLIAGIGYLVFKNHDTTPDRFVIEKKYDLPAGTDQATLTLSDGRVIDLNKDAVGKIATDAGIEITKSSEGTLVYKVSNAKGKSVGFNTITTPIGGQYTIILPDGSKVWLNSGSSLKYPTAFAASGRNVVLTGEGYFEVAHIEGAKGRVPFSVSVIRNNAQSEKVQVLGTHFNINAYADEPFIKTTLLKGSVSVTLNDNKTTLLKPGQLAKLSNQNIQVQEADTEMAVAWKNGAFVFREDLRSAMRKVARWYDVEIVYEETAPENLMLGGWMSRGTNISEVLNHIQLTGKVHFKLEGRRVIVSK